MSESEAVNWEKLGEAIKRRYIVEWARCNFCGRYTYTVHIGDIHICGSNKCLAKFIGLLAGALKRWSDAFL